jgi:hypothetical protein
MEPHLEINDKKIFYEYLDKSNNYFEFGSGGSTYQASIRNNIKKIYSVESDLEWHNKLKNMLNKNTNIDFIYNEMDTRPNTWGNPGPNSTKNQHINYSNQILFLDKNKIKDIDFILIDGRFRVACCLKCFDVITNNCFIAFDDFLNRSYYHIVLNYYDIIKQTNDNRMVILQKKKDCKFIPKEIIEKYELIKG